MSFENIQYDEGLFTRDQKQPGEGRIALALLAGLVAAVVAGGLWAALVFVTDMEIGYVAWAVGLLVGFAMSKTTARRSKQLAFAAALFAVVGLLAGKAFIFAGSSRTLAADLEGDQDAMSATVAWQMYEARTLDQATLGAVDAVPDGEQLPTALWTSMKQQGSAKLATLSSEQKHELAVAGSKTVLQNIGMIGGIRAQLSGFDLLWLFLAVGTAFRMMSPAKEAEPVAEPAVTA
jgi:hypothetical protein